MNDQNAKEEIKKLRAENVELRKSLESALLRCNHGHDEDQDHCLCWQCEDDRKVLNSQHNATNPTPWRGGHAHDH